MAIGSNGHRKRTCLRLCDWLEDSPGWLVFPEGISDWLVFPEGGFVWLEVSPDWLVFPKDSPGWPICPEGSPGWLVFSECRRGDQCVQRQVLFGLNTFPCFQSPVLIG